MVDNKVFVVGVVAVLVIGGMFAVNAFVSSDGITGAAFFDRFKTYSSPVLDAAKFKNCACPITVECMTDYEHLFGHSLYVWNGTVSSIPVIVDNGLLRDLTKNVVTNISGLTFVLGRAGVPSGNCGFTQAQIYVAPTGTCTGLRNVVPDCSQAKIIER